jgi:YD repeat-containing protein
VLRSIRRGGSLAALLELLSGDPQATRDADVIRAALAWNPRRRPIRIARPWAPSPPC